MAGHSMWFRFTCVGWRMRISVGALVGAFGTYHSYRLQDQKVVDDVDAVAEGVPADVAKFFDVVRSWKVEKDLTGELGKWMRVLPPSRRR